MIEDGSGKMAPVSSEISGFAAPSAADSFFIQSDFDRSLVQMVKASAPRGQYSARSAIRHIDKAAAIAELDPEMAAFRAITAEEESATAIFHALRRHKYLGSEQLQPHDHLQKNAVRPFCLAVSELIERVHTSFNLNPSFSVDKEDGELRMGTRFHAAGVGGGDRWAMPQPPLNMAISAGDPASAMQLHDFTEQLQEIADNQHAFHIRVYLKQRANARNEILYASATGLPSVILNKFLEEQRRVVQINLRLFLLIDQYPEHQLLAKQALRAFLSPDRAAFPFTNSDNTARQTFKIWAAFVMVRLSVQEFHPE